ncbi:ATP-dependent RNA helicase HrpA [Rubritalea marina]|uniref:ATP-dependent RNA helicase HrpA n=1 Tax=Rubritalea marina TaxID=361055 RepID=UPI0003725C0A|nr:ATP-dependent RNA helicase HrpA [Rubritalea marina]
MIGDKIQYPKLPVSAHRQEVIEALCDHQVVVVMGDTGSGKTTQLPKMALEYLKRAGSQGIVGCTQPRRLAASSVAKRVAEELKVTLGNEVGYQVRFQDKTNADTVLKFMTDGILLAETQGAPQLGRYGVIIIDEAHERSLNIDFLLGYLKVLLERRKDLRVMISSATLDAGGFADFFGEAPVIDVAGRTFPVETEYLPQERGEDMSRHVARAVEALQRGSADGDVLVFLPGEREIRECVDVLEGRQMAGLEILPLFARMGLQEQQRIFNPNSSRRRVILATNVAETSLTIPGIVYVIDSGVARMSRWSPARQVQRLQIEKTSQASAKQRKGRCGRICEGVCIRLYDEEDFESREPFTDPEIRRSSLAGVILRMKSLGLADIEDFPFIDPPSSKHIAEGYKTLREIEALDSEHGLTQVGRQLARIPVEPRLGRMLLEAKSRNCLDAMLVVVSGLSIMDPRERPAEKAKEADQAHEKWRDEDSDFMSLLHLWGDLQQFKDGRKWRQNQLRKFCRQKFVNFRRVLEWANLHHELAALGREAFRWRSHVLTSDEVHRIDYEALHKSLLVGMPKQVGFFDKEKRAYKSPGGKEFAIFPGSGLFGKKRLDWVIAYEMVDTTRLWARRVAKFDPLWLEEVAPQFCRSRYHSAAWDKKQGAVYAKEVVVYGGLKIVENRNVHFGRIDPDAAHKIFIREALLGGGLTKKPTVLQKVEAMREEVLSLEVKLRRRDGLWSEESVVEYFEAQVPKHIHTAKSFWRWMSKEKVELEPKVEDLVYGEMPETAGFPDYFGEGEFPLYYKVAPGEADDGITVGVHIDSLSLFPNQLLDWGVSGQLEERTLLMIKSLPKSQRVACNPAGQTAQAFLAAYSDTWLMREYEEALAEFLSDRTGIRIEPAMFDTSRIPNELKLKLWVYDDEENELAFGMDAAAIKSDLAALMAERFEEESGAEWDYSGMKRWDCGELPREVVSPKGTAYPSLVDEGDAVGVKVFSDRFEAERQHLAGCVRLFMLQHADHVKYVSKNLTLSLDAKMYMPLLGKGGMNQAELMRILVSACFQKDLPRDAASFSKLADLGRGDLYLYGEQLCEALSQFIDDYRSVVSWLEANEGNSNLREIVEDLQEELDWLFRSSFAQRVGWKDFIGYRDFFAGMKERIDRLKTHPIVKDLEKMDRLLLFYIPWYDTWKERPDHAELLAIGYQLERYRVSQFAPSIKQDQVLSEKKLRQLIEDAGIVVSN